MLIFSYILATPFWSHPVGWETLIYSTLYLRELLLCLGPRKEMCFLLQRERSKCLCSRQYSRQLCSQQRVFMVPLQFPFAFLGLHSTPVFCGMLFFSPALSSLGLLFFSRSLSSCLTVSSQLVSCRKQSLWSAIRPTICLWGERCMQKDSAYETVYNRNKLTLSPPLPPPPSVPYKDCGLELSSHNWIFCFSSYSFVTVSWGWIAVRTRWILLYQTSIK